MESFATELNQNDIELLIEECKNELSSSMRELGMLLVKQQIIRKKITEWKSEKEWLELLRDTNFDQKQYFDSLTKGKAKTIKKRYNELMDRFNDQFSDLKVEKPVEKEKVEKEKSHSSCKNEKNEKNEKNDKSDKQIHPPTTPRKSLIKKK